MCGFTGAISYHNIDNSKISEGNNFIECRGPDSKLTLKRKVNDLNISLIFNRLSILDLSEKANQPMYSKKFNTTLMFNGEIFNHNELREELIRKGLEFTTSHSDSETVLLGLSYFGMSFIDKMKGQFSIFFYDENKNTAYLIRDRLGQKPLYYSLDESTLTFGSSLLSLLKIKKTYSLSSTQVYNYLNYGIVSSPNTLFKDFYKVCPAEIIQISFKGGKPHSTKSIYWKPEEYLGDKSFDKDQFFDILTESIDIRASADVKVANFLSGGIDSTAITKNLYDKGTGVNSFSVYFDNAKYDESKYINEVTNKYNLNHKSILISADIKDSDIFQALESLDEPYSDPSVLPSFVLSREISKHYKVAISGDGGDELLGGYVRTADSLKYKSSFVNNISKLYSLYPPFLGTGNRFLSKSSDLEQRYRSYLEDNKFMNLLKIDSERNSYAQHLNSSNYEPYKRLLVADYKFYLPEMMMFKVDRTSMKNSLEVRSPFVDHKLIEFILSSSTDYVDIHNPKKILKEYLNEDFGVNFTKRKKQGFVFDVESWVYKNINLVNEIINNGEIAKGLNQNIVSQLSIYKSRINGQRIWKIFVLEEYLSRVRSL